MPQCGLNERLLAGLELAVGDAFVWRLQPPDFEGLVAAIENLQNGPCLGGFCEGCRFQQNDENKQEEMSAQSGGEVTHQGIRGKGGEHRVGGAARARENLGVCGTNDFSKSTNEGLVRRASCR